MEKRESKKLCIVDPNSGKDILSELKKPIQEKIEFKPLIPKEPFPQLKHEKVEKEFQKNYFEIKKGELYFDGIIDFKILSAKKYSQFALDFKIKNFSENKVVLLEFEIPISLKELIKIKYNEKETNYIALDMNQASEFQIMLNISNPKFISEKITIKIRNRKYTFDIKAIVISENDLKLLNPFASSFITSNMKNSWNVKPMSILETNILEKPWNWSMVKDFKGNESKFEIFSKENYIKLFTNLLKKEEESYKQDFNIFDMYMIPLKSKKQDSDVYQIKVPGISEQRPPICHGDLVLARFSQKTNMLEAKGYICKIDSMNSYIYVKFKDLKKYITLWKSNQFNIRFVYSSEIFKLMRNSLQKTIVNQLFPSHTDIPFEKAKYHIKCEFDQDLNQEQRKACDDILNNNHGYIPYIIFGPPGTGKTKIIVEIVKVCLHSSNYKKRILLCSPSNTASDILTQRLKDFCEKYKVEIFRLNYHRTLQSVPIDILKYCHQENDFFGLPKLDKYQIIITTTECIPILNHQANIQKGCFDYIIVDENCQGLEPEVVMALNLSNLSTQVVLAGDHFQLGPIVRSNSDVLAKSLQERLYEMEIYKKNSNCCQMLVKNYRSHEKIFEVSSKLFYSSKIEMKANQDIVSSLCKWNKLKNQKFPLLFEGIEGEEIREGESASWYNPIEALKIREYIQDLLSDKNIKIEPKDIAVITPYRKQVQKIRILLRDCNLAQIRVGNIEDYQGQEEKVILISTVRSNLNCLRFDQLHSIGIVNNPQRFNVAISRAKSLLIVIGNPNILKIDPNWSYFIRNVYENGNYLGCDCPSEIVNNVPIKLKKEEYAKNYFSIDEKQWLLK